MAAQKGEEKSERIRLAEETVLKMEWSRSQSGLQMEIAAAETSHFRCEVKVIRNEWLLIAPSVIYYVDSDIQFDGGIEAAALSILWIRYNGVSLHREKGWSCQGYRRKECK